LNGHGGGRTPRPGHEAPGSAGTRSRPASQVGAKPEFPREAGVPGHRDHAAKGPRPFRLRLAPGIQFPKGCSAGGETSLPTTVSVGCASVGNGSTARTRSSLDRTVPSARVTITFTDFSW